MAMALPDGETLTNDEITNLWKEVTATSPDVEQHRLKCAMPLNITSANEIVGGTLTTFFLSFI